MPLFRPRQGLVPFNCTAVPKELSEGYLFGYRRGASRRRKRFCAGDRTAVAAVISDEIGDLPARRAAEDLRFLQEGEIQPVGEQRPVKSTCGSRATNSDLEEMVAQEDFAEDLYYRLNVIRWSASVAPSPFGNSTLVNY